MTMKEQRVLLALVATAVIAATGCGDDRGLASPSQHDATDTAIDGGPHQTHDGAAPDLWQAHDLSTLGDRSASSADLVPDQSAPTGSSMLAGKVSVASGITCGATPGLDCKGYLYVGVIDQPVAPPASTLLGSAAIDAADLGGGKTVSYQISGLPPNTIVYVAAMLAELPPGTTPPTPKSGDLVAAPKATLLPAGSTVTQDVTLDARW